MSDQWLGLALAGLKLIGRKFRRKIVKVRPYLVDLISMEKLHGDQDLWGSVDTAAAGGSDVMLSREQVQQLAHFKRIWDKHMKKPLSRVSAQMDKDAVAAMIKALTTD